eukprot:CAMPEP_0197661554 /NCGR_PEP_ID=MMETSP1338-20131121/51523_1 /TAXON_ID=43686 ORGANISM="Pelagodinium beii, Strain RCC1491" /NCGR_SAMPLE_ID=MMETSP1338 /ASSEMBLY_ACC=CAM_ASM_000754 /LENGTH=303 /DNA_ID=CAMNT_0043239123 /DNA_START=54 /DNA_END=965 /DNA_ORIENTATION=+
MKQPPDLPDEPPASEAQVDLDLMLDNEEEEVPVAKKKGTASSASVPRVLSMDSLAVNGSGDDARVEKTDPRDVWVHVYHCDDYTGYLNRILLKDSEIGIYHAGIEVYGQEWSFQYFEDTWNDPSISGLIRCRPKSMRGYEYQESLNLGRTPLSEFEVDRLLLNLNSEWPANSYHLTHRNCITFAQQLAILLKPPQPFPAWLLGVLEASNQNESLDAIVDYSWSWAKWWMMRKYEQETADEHNERQEQDSSWYAFFMNNSSCTGGLCPGPAKRPTNKEATTELPALVEQGVQPVEVKAIAGNQA